ncbi:MAG: hypothetical protein KME22_11820 [Hassallia sp. WJT32-NPBG1]|nr:hypothetical protein [Hassallia sp. WJT32-NPBG1]
MGIADRLLCRDDILFFGSPLGELLDAYMQETFQRTWGGTIQQLEQDGFGTEFEIIIAGTSEQ